VMIDGDGTYDPEEIPRLISSLGNADLVMGNRFSGMEAGAMTALNRVGNRAFSLLIRWFYRSPIKDSQSGMRAIRREALERLTLTEDGMPLATEMVIQAAKHRLRVVEVPIHYRRRRGEAKLHPFRDGWGILKCILKNKIQR